MKELTIVVKKKLPCADSREVADMVEKNHAHLCRDITNYIDVINKSANPKLDSLVAVVGWIAISMQMFAHKPWPGLPLPSDVQPSS